MLDRNINDYPEIYRETWKRVQERHPNRTTAGGALFAEIASTSASIDDRNRAADLYGLMSYKRGLRTFDKIAWNVYNDISAKLSKPESFFCGSERFFFSALLRAIARIDSPESHSVLKRYLFSIENPHLRADVLEAMAFEKNEFDAELTFSTLEGENDEPLLLSGLYALSFHGSDLDPETVRKRFLPFLEHESGLVRSFTVEVLSYDRENLDVISKLSDDPHAGVRDYVAAAIRYIEMDDETS